VFQEVLPRAKYRSAGMLVAEAYREDFGQEPPQRQQFVDGGPRQVKSYRRSWLMDTTITMPNRQRVWVTTAEACAALGMSRETLRQLRLHPGSRAPAVASRERGGHHYRLEPQASAALKARNRM